MSFFTVEWRDGNVLLLDQTRLPNEEIYTAYEDYRDVAEAITSMVVRGAPAIGVTAAYGLALAARNIIEHGEKDFAAEFERACTVFEKTRPTAVNLFWAVARMRDLALSMEGAGAGEIARSLEAEAHAIHSEDVAANRRLGSYGAQLLPSECTILTHCNAGALATAGYGTALGVVRAAVEAGKKVYVIADETRPFLQGARLTAWELVKDTIPVTIITDNMAGYRMKLGGVDAVVVGADRISANGDVANKIGTYSLSVLARENRVPFYVAAPLSTVDLSLASGDLIPIEERNPAEVTHCMGVRCAPEGAGAWNPAFDVTPAANISAIITEAGVARHPYEESLAKLKGERQ